MKNEVNHFFIIFISWQWVKWLHTFNIFLWLLNAQLIQQMSPQRQRKAHAVVEWYIEVPEIFISHCDPISKIFLSRQYFELKKVCSFFFFN